MRYKILILLILLLIPQIAYANSVLPVLVMAWPIQIFLFIPIVILEGLLIAYSINITFKKALWPTIKANMISTLVGVPIACIILLAPLIAGGLGIRFLEKFIDIPRQIDGRMSELFMAIFFAPSSNQWEVGIKFICFFVPFCFVSIIMEEKVLVRCFPDIDKRKIRFANVRSNICSYMLLSLFALAFAYFLSLGGGNGPKSINM